MYKHVCECIYPSIHVQTGWRGISLDSNEPEATEFRIKLAYKNHKGETVNQVLPCKYLWKSARWLLAQ